MRFACAFPSASLRCAAAAIPAAALFLGCPPREPEVEIVPIERRAPAAASASSHGPSPHGGAAPLTDASSEALPPGHPPLAPSAPRAVGGPAQTAEKPSGGAGAATAHGIRFRAPEGWIEEPPSSRMRLVQYALPSAEKDSEPGQVVVFFFGGAAGGVEANLARWYQQWQTADGRPAQEIASTEHETVNDLPVTFVELLGTYVAETQPGSGVRVNKPDFMLLGAIVEAADGNYFVKGTGPAKTMQRWREAFRGLIRGVER